MSVSVLAPAKVNFTLEVLARRSDGYHEIASLIQTVALADQLVLGEAAELSLELTGPYAAGLAGTAEANLALLAARALAVRAGGRRGATVRLEKNVPAAMGFGGGSSDAAAVLRGLDRLWRLDASLADLTEVAAGLGSDVAFFLHGGTCLLSGRGEAVESLPDHPETPLILLAGGPAIADKTRRMYALLDANAFTHAERTRTAAESVRAGSGLRSDQLGNAFETCVGALAPDTLAALAACRAAGLPAQVSGSGPGIYVYGSDALDAPLAAELAALGFAPIATRTLARRDALAIEES